MTYKQLLERLKTFTPEQLAMDVLYQDTNDGEFYGLSGVKDGGDYGGAEVGLAEGQMLLDIEQ